MFDMLSGGAPILWLQVGTNLAIGLACVAIAATLARLSLRTRDIPFRRFLLVVSVFVVACGVTRFMDVWGIWHPDDRMDATLGVLAAVASVGAALWLPPLVPKIDRVEAPFFADVIAVDDTDEQDLVVDGTRPVALVVEGDGALRRSLRRLLEPDYQVMTATNGAAGAECVARLRPDIIVTDLMMPVPSGQELVHHVRDQEELEGVPIVVLSATSDEATRVDLLRSGVQDWVQKPFLPRELRARIDNLVQVARVRRILQAQLATQSTDLEAMARELGVARELAERSSDLKSSFLRAVSHELRSPLHALGLQLRLLERGDPMVRERMTERMGESLARMRMLVESLLQKARLEGQAVQFEVTSFDVASLASEVVDRERPQALDKGLVTSVVAEIPLPPLRSDRDLVKLILSNLVGNAVKFTQRGEVRVELTVQADTHLIVVSDTGPGLAPAAQGLLFEPFTPAPSERAHQPGLGLGLSLVRDLARALGGEVDVTTGADGTEMRVALPSLERDVVA